MGFKNIREPRKLNFSHEFTTNLTIIDTNGIVTKTYFFLSKGPYLLQESWIFFTLSVGFQDSHNFLSNYEISHNFLLKIRVLFLFWLGTACKTAWKQSLSVDYRNLCFSRQQGKVTQCQQALLSTNQSRTFPSCRELVSGGFGNLTNIESNIFGKYSKSFTLASFFPSKSQKNWGKITNDVGPSL